MIDIFDIVSQLGLKFGDLQGMDMVQFRAYVACAEHKTNTFRETLGMQLGSLLDKETLQDLFLSGDSDEGPPADSEHLAEFEDEEKTKPSKLFTPLALLINPDLHAKMKKRAEELVDLEDVLPSEDVTIPGVDMDEADLLWLQAQSRKADKILEQNKIERAKALATPDEERDRIAGIDATIFVEE